ncbi:unnamed protein product [Clonostachys rhizophaga]|uniref:Transcription factor domain-containing protein n=1 Tax=Clonostachys rhizophaga TaxID=160324 RepID=A0A9N9VGE1_9HYPO|nr:unnamed protein product [Clonostachys rhizophaga]
MSLLNKERQQSPTPSKPQTPHIRVPEPSPFQASIPSSASNQLDAEGPYFVLGQDLTFEEADQSLQYYQTEMLPQFPFVPLPVCRTSELYHASPLLLKTILRACRPLGPERDAIFERWFRQHVVYRIAVLMEKSTELLQAILVFAAWNPVGFYVGGGETSLLQLAIGIVGELGLTKRPDAYGHKSVSIVDDAMWLRNEKRPRPPQHRNIDRRATLGVFYLTSMLSSLLGKVCRLEYVSYFDDCCRVLLEAKEFDTDRLLVHLIRLRKISLKVSDVFWGRNDSIHNTQSWSMHSMATATVQKELESFMETLPRPLQSSRMAPLIKIQYKAFVNGNGIIDILRVDCAAIRIRLLEPAIHSPGNTRDPTLLRSRLMWDCLSATQEVFDSFVETPVEEYSAFTFVSMLNLALAIVKCIKLLSAVDDPDWDVETARRSCDLYKIFLQLSDRWEASRLTGKPRCSLVKDGKPLATKYSDRFKWLAGWYLSKATANPSSDPSASIPSGPFLGDGGLMNHNGDPGSDFWEELGNWTYGIDIAVNDLIRY